MPEESQQHEQRTPANPAAGEATTPEVSKERAPSSSEPAATDIPTANAPDPNAANPEANPNAAKPKEKPAKAKPAAKADDAGDGAPAAKAPKKEKPAKAEDKPFADFVHQDYLPALKTALNGAGLQDIDLSLQKQKLPIAGLDAGESWQVVGRWQGGKRQFNIYFPKSDINGPRGFSCADSGAKPSTIEPFLIDERKITLDLLVFGVVQRLNAQKWLERN